MPLLALVMVHQKVGSPLLVRLSCSQGLVNFHKCLKEHGFRACRVDHKRCKNRVGPCVVMDLTRAPPCGTASRGKREKTCQNV